MYHRGSSGSTPGVPDWNFLIPIFYKSRFWASNTNPTPKTHFLVFIFGYQGSLGSTPGVPDWPWVRPKKVQERGRFRTWLGRNSQPGTWKVLDRVSKHFRPAGKLANRKAIYFSNFGGNCCKGADTSNSASITNGNSSINIDLTFTILFEEHYGLSFQSKKALATQEWQISKKLTYQICQGPIEIWPG